VGPTLHRPHTDGPKGSRLVNRSGSCRDFPAWEGSRWQEPGRIRRNCASGRCGWSRRYGRTTSRTGRRRDHDPEPRPGQPRAQQRRPPATDPRTPRPSRTAATTPAQGSTADTRRCPTVNRAWRGELDLGPSPGAGRVGSSGLPGSGQHSGRSCTTPASTRHPAELDRPGDSSSPPRPTRSWPATSSPLTPCC
jgi:hypothetical protein